MAGISDNERVLHTLYDVRAGKMISKSMTGMTRDYDLFFTENGIAFVNTVSGLKGHTIRAVGAQFGIVGALVKAATVDKAKNKQRTELQGLNLKETLGKSKDSFFLPYDEVRTVKIKQGFGAASRMRIQNMDVSYELLFPKAQMDSVNAAISDRLGTKIVEWKQKS
jgi:hypothetical protein